MTKHRAASLLLLALAACSKSEDPRPATTTAGPGADASAVQLCPGTRIVAVLDRPTPTPAPEGACELAGALPSSWRATPLFEGGSPLVAALDAPAPGELSRYCAYEFHGQGAPTTEAMLAALAAAPSIQAHSVGLDCDAGTGHGVPRPPDITPALHEAFRHAIGWVPAEQLADSQGARAPIEVAIVDSLSARAAADASIIPAHPHGPAMGALITDLACPDRDDACTENLRHTLALPRLATQSEANWTAGGELGTASDVALGVYLAVERWRRRSAAAHLVINLSVGWETRDLDAGPERALRAALEYASCQGALIFAAAGNGANLGCEPSTGPLTPARHEALPAPDARECHALGFAGAPSSSDTQPTRPLVHAVAGVDPNGRPLANARIGARPRLATAASHATAPLAGGDYSLAMSGSSVAAAASSGIAALLWSYRPDLSPAQLVELLYASGTPTDGVAAFGLGEAGKGTPVRRMSACSALARACEGRDPHACPQLDCPALEQADEHAATLVREATEARRAATPRGAVKVHRNAARVVEQECEPRQSSLAAPI